MASDDGGLYPKGFSPFYFPFQTSALPGFFVSGGFMNQGHGQLAATTVGETAKSAPHFAVVSMSWAGVSLNDLMLIPTLVWLSVLFG